MIELSVINNRAFVFNIEDWKKLRTDYRIIGDLCGSTQYITALPLCLMAEEAAFLIMKGFAKLVKHDVLREVPKDVERELQEKKFNTLLCHENNAYQNIRREQLEPLIDKIIEGKRRKGKIGDNVTREAALDEEVAKSSELTFNTMIVPIEVEQSKELRGISVDVAIEEILLKDTLQSTRISVFNDLWEKGFYITPGFKFGGDYLCYIGDPLIYHAMYIIRCIDKTTLLDLNELIAFGRLGTSVKKKAVFAFKENGNIKYITITWSDI